MVDMPEEQAEPLGEPGISLDALAAAYAESTGRREPSRSGDARHAEDDDAPPVEVREAEGDAPLPSSPGGGEEDDDGCELGPRSILEAMLFVGNQQSEPLTAARAAELMRGVSPDEIADLVDELNRRYASNGCPYRITSEGPGYRLTLHPAFRAVRSKFYGRVREARLSQAALDVLAIVAYRQPITGDEVSKLRDSPSAHQLSQLVRRQLLRVERPPEKRRPVVYRTTGRFLELFGLRSLEDLPESED